MIDPLNITNFDRTDAELEEVMLFWICVAGKKSSTIAPRLDKVLSTLRDWNPIYTYYNPLALIRSFHKWYLIQLLRENGIGCYNMKASAMLQLAWKVTCNLNLRTCSAEELMEIKGIGWITARCFIIHSRRDSRYAGLDTHILHFLHDCGYNCPRTTPSSKKEYLKWEQILLRHIDYIGISVAEFDLAIWTAYSQKDEEGKNAFLRIYAAREVVG